MTEKRQPLQQMLLEKLDVYMQKTEIRFISFTLYKYQLKVDKGLYMSPETLKLVQKITGHKLELIGIGNDFLNRTQMDQQLRERIHK
jgi:hypothetical protein